MISGILFQDALVHPITPVPGGFTKIPSISELKEIKRKLVEEGLPDVKKTSGNY